MVMYLSICDNGLIITLENYYQFFPLYVGPLKIISNQHYDVIIKLKTCSISSSKDWIVGIPLLTLPRLKIFHPLFFNIKSLPENKIKDYIHKDWILKWLSDTFSRRLPLPLVRKGEDTNEEDRPDETTPVFWVPSYSTI